MKRIKSTIFVCMALLTIWSCGDIDDITGDAIEIGTDYILPQSGASATANGRITDIYNKYGSYVLYDFDQKDALWQQYTGTASVNYFTTVTKGDFENVEKMLNFLDETWLGQMNDDFLRNGGIPYRVFLADSIYETRFGRKYTSNMKVLGNAIILSGMNKIPTMSESNKNKYRKELLSTLWSYYKTQGILKIPDEFYSVSDYVTLPEMTYESGWYYFEEDQYDEFYSRGFTPLYQSYLRDWPEGSDLKKKWASARSQDLDAYNSLIFYLSDEDMEEFLAYPLIQKKWRILLQYYKDKYGINLRKVLGYSGDL